MKIINEGYGWKIADSGYGWIISLWTKVPEREIKGTRVVLTLSSDPEQYEVFLKDRQIGYLRLKHGRFIGYAPDHKGSKIYEGCPNGYDEFDEDERERYLTASVQRILLEMKLNDPYSEITDNQIFSVGE